MRGKRTVAAALVAGAGALLAPPATLAEAAAGLAPGVHVEGAEVTGAQVRAVASGGGGRGAPAAWVAWDDLERTTLAPGRYQVRVGFVAEEGASVEVPVCAGRGRVEIDGREVDAPPGPLVVSVSPGSHDVVVTVDVSGYERRIACGQRPRVGTAAPARDGLSVLTFASPSSARGGGRAVVFVPPGRADSSVRAPLLVGLHPWNGTIWTYAAYAPLLREARARGVLLLMPSGLGNSLYTADAEDEVMRAIAALTEVLPVDSAAVSLWGASMGGAGATTIGFHRPDHFASVTSFFGDSKYDLATYVHALLPTEAAAHLVNALDVVDSARNLPVWLAHGEDDRTSPIRQSEMLADALRTRGFRVRFDRVAGEGHSGRLVARFLPELVASAASARVADHPGRVTFRSVRGSDTEAYGVRMVRAAGQGDAFVDVALEDGALRVRRADGLRALVLSPGALGASRVEPPRIVVDTEARGLDIRWGPLGP